MLEDKHNYTDKNITEFVETDTVYMQKTLSGYMTSFLLRFKSFEKGLITGEILDIQPNNVKSIWVGKEILRIGDDISGKISNCYTFEKGHGCRWFKKVDKIWKCS